MNDLKEFKQIFKPKKTTGKMMKRLDAEDEQKKNYNSRQQQLKLMAAVKWLWDLSTRNLYVNGMISVRIPSLVLVSKR